MAEAQVNTGKVTDRRALHFRSLDDLAADVEAIAAAERAGRLRRTGNWTAGQALGHLAMWMSFGHDGYPTDLDPPWIIKQIIKFQRSKFFKGPMPKGVRIPGVEGGTKATEPLSLDEGLSRMRIAIGRLRGEAPSRAHPIFGPLSHDEWKVMHLRHAELHLGFLHPQ